MGKQFVFLAIVLFMILASLALTLVGILTDNWYSVSTEDKSNTTFESKWNYHYGMWKRCYNTLPNELKESMKTGDCVYIYKDLIKRNEHDLSYDDRLHLHLSRSYVAFAIVCGAVQLSTLLTLICGVWPAKCKLIKRSRLYLSSALMLLLATMCGIVSGICFIALRDSDADINKIYPLGVAVNYGWSFMIHWIATGLCLVESFILLCLLKESYDDVAEKFSYYNIY
ncbi:uncharacterized protein LOC126810812 [Patella vulgata]|uniref:uncharacterized protein LOC126810812 n=1 Tax=Patella vulgata TaxID=6465 RepID=UPI00218043C9|nr:uncharacterized protein LOC126810812 [Patella vulgata]